MPRPLQSRKLRQAIVTTLRADADLTALGNPPLSDRIYGRRVPAGASWPFIRVNLALEGPLRKGTTVRVTVHAFSKATFDDECEALNAAIQTALEDAALQLGASTIARLAWFSSQVMPDIAEADAWHGVNSFDAAIG